MIDKKLWPVFSEYIRLRDSNENGFCTCITCPNIRYWKNMDCGHGISRGHMGTKYHEENNHAQCKICNCHKRGNPVEYKKAVDKKYGPGTWEKIQAMARIPTKFGGFEVSTMLFYFQEEIKKLRAAKNLRE